MKKRLFAIIMILSLLLASCGEYTAQNTSSAVSGTASVPIEESNAETAYDRIQKIDALYGEPLDRTGMERFPISEGKTVTASREGEGALSMLTDGKHVENNDISSAVHFSGKTEISIVLDMGETVDNITDMGISLYTNMGMNASLPQHIQFYVSDNGKDFLEVGTVYRALDATLNASNLFLLSLQGKISFRYLKAMIPADAFLSSETYVDEICVYGHRKRTEADMLTENFYKNEPLPEITGKEYWESSEADYDKEQNLVQGKPYRVMCPYRMDGIYVTDSYYNTQPKNGMLTDGKIGTGSFTSVAFFHISSYLERTIIFDLEKVSGVSSVTVGMLKSTPEGLNLPSCVKILGSYDGKVWGELASGVPTSPGDYVRTAYTLEFEKTAVRFLSVTVEGIKGHLWMDEISVTGTKSIDGAVEKEFLQTEDPNVNEYLSPDALGGVENILLTYTYRAAENPEAGLNSADELMPYVAYLDEQGNIKDTFFDGFLFLPSGQQFPSGGHLYYDSENPSRMIDWVAVGDNFFAPDHNVGGLNEAVRRLNEAMDTNTKMPIYLSIFSTVYGDKGFGDVDGDGKNEDFSNIEDRKKVILWWIDRMETQFAAGGYDNLKIDGFYWNHENMEANDPHEKELINFTADYLHSKGYYFIWIPYYMARGFNEWKSYGFDAVVMQPNYMFNDLEEQRLYNNADFAKKFGMGVEIEADYGVTSNPVLKEKYMAYLRAGVETGYMNSVKMYYQDAGPGVFYNAYHAKDSFYREVYEMTYRYAKGTLTFEMKPLASTTYTGKQDKKLMIFPKGEDGKLVECALAQAPKYGSVQQASNGRFYYYPAEGFTGTDTFVVCDPHNPDAPGTTITVVIE